MNVREYGDFLQDILGSIDYIEDFLADYEADDFINDKRTVFAVLWCLRVLGEAAKHIPAQVRDLYPEIPWEDMTGMRDKVVHGYFGINLEVVWDTATCDLPQVKPLVEMALREIDKQENLE
jgi:uncharacterized protein with HEPN domain